MKYLLDTQTFVWWIENDKKLSSAWRAEIGSPENTVLVSVVSAWEMSIKMRSGKLRLKTTWEDCFGGNLEFDALNVTLNHISELQKLPLLHKDPFDRLLVAQAQAEGCTLITSDERLRSYRVPILN
ncbi:type II toxin-antitoxin system VapC family toxin [Candidatus Gottesmanbacteria bacterium]|nr:type II toxin-antitoxin system VapC family toxin [Candidatus Gottesmanbacteria bacterium]